jgi:DNA-binding LytR/AlgR family response regulator
MKHLEAELPDMTEFDALRLAHIDRGPLADSLGARVFKILVGDRERRLYPLNADAIDYIESDGNYVTIRTANSQYISRDSIKRLSADLAAHGFIRIERSLLLNIRAVSYVEPVGRGTFAFTLASGSCLHSGASYRESILRVLPMRRQPSGRRCVTHESG